MSLVLIPDGPGISVEVVDGRQGLPAAPRGSGAIMGQFPSGPTTKAALVLTRDKARLISGDPDDLFEGSLALDDLYSEYTPPVLIARVTDGNDLQARSYLWDRDPSLSWTKFTGHVIDDRAPMATVTAQNGGRWGGRKRVLVGLLNAVATDVTASTIDLSTASELEASMYKEDMLAGATLELEGDTGGPYEIVSNTTAGIATIKGEFSTEVLAADGSGDIDGQFRIVLAHDKELSVVIGQDSILSSQFSLSALRKFKSTSDWEVVSRYDNLELSTSDNRPWVSTITEGELERYQIAVSSSYSGATVEEKLPCNFSEVPTSVSTNTLTFQWYRWAVTTGNGTGYITGVAPVDADSVEPHIYRLTFTAATTYDLTVEWADGTVQELAAAHLMGAFEPDHPQLTEFTITAGGTAFTAGDVVTLRVNTLPLDLYKREAFIYPKAVGTGAGKRSRIVSNTYNSVTIRSDLDFADFDSAVGASPTVTGTASLAAVTFTIGNTLILTPDGGAPVTLTSTTGPTGAANIVAHLTALDTAGKFVFSVYNTNYLRIQLAGSYGSQSSIAVGNGTSDAQFGLTNGDVEYGTDAVPFRIEARWPMCGGYDGAAPAAARYALALDLSNSVFKCHMNTNLGLVRLGIPGLTTAVSSAGIDAALLFCAANGWIHVVDTPTSLETLSDPGEAAVDYLLTQVESDYRQWRFPSRLKYLNTAGTKIVTRSSAGQVIGRYALLANVGIDGERGMHIAAANNNAQGALSPRAKGLPDGVGRWSPPIGLMDSNGIVPILWDGPNVYMYGNRMFSSGRTPAGGRYTITERAVYYHVARDLFVTARPVVFKSISARRLGEVTSMLRDKMRPYYNDGWFSDQGGTKLGFEDQVTVEVPASLNPPADLQEGRVRAAINFTPRPAIEKVSIILAPTQISGS